MSNTNTVLIGARVRIIRESLGFARPEIARKIGVSYQQFAKYETGENRISAARLVDVAKAMDVPITAFFADFEAADEQSPPPFEPGIIRSDTISLIRAFSQIECVNTRKSIVYMVNNVQSAIDDAARREPDPKAKIETDAVLGAESNKDPSGEGAAQLDRDTDASLVDAETTDTAD
ncbi:MAG: helix-turn-helix transcriptional regulator [Pseudomonadota bacterium]